MFVVKILFASYSSIFLHFLHCDLMVDISLRLHVLLCNMYDSVSEFLINDTLMIA